MGEQALRADQRRGSQVRVADGIDDQLVARQRRSRVVKLRDDDMFLESLVAYEIVYFRISVRARNQPQNADRRLFAAVRHGNDAAPLKGRAPVPIRPVRVSKARHHKRHADVRLPVLRIDLQRVLQVPARLFEFLGLNQKDGEIHAGQRIVRMSRQRLIVNFSRLRLVSRGHQKVSQIVQCPCVRRFQLQQLRVGVPRLRIPAHQPQHIGSLEEKSRNVTAPRRNLFRSSRSVESVHVAASSQSPCQIARFKTARRLPRTRIRSPCLRKFHRRVKSRSHQTLGKTHG